ncbi:hypothetical protein COV42_01535 [Candidatus Campbellbacteria bacterium CG11_big_fil_rev_8_21_14_0_20_44_21]|uniref:Uncharacterized protein n=1 Tax=Candidatus Campbellbacteria bacterium CG22_combo_CG10-13_8_21_14_all_43_18 TaxID=1974530 RepID=A0A2H0DWZ5_9BACT|nr:MAG: hypothetical protein COW82_02410 [Candidatus Campbellbacteria bacterium CG22_combo_CG10-13_8_21_14_all_43_18]PIR24287.1 MAG: hypothetical protein COV42_01535 [Candidatus Campbellbacteria bacterium CG11_big_fil_rev_8_21_14_0_20_44_21]
MKALTIKKLNIRGETFHFNPHLEKRIMVFLFVLIFFFAAMYIYFVKQAIVNVVQREKVEEEISELDVKVGSLEERYIELENRIDLDFAYSLGYNEIQDVRFVSRKTLGQILTFEEN